MHSDYDPPDTVTAVHHRQDSCRLLTHRSYLQLTFISPYTLCLGLQSEQLHHGDYLPEEDSPEEIERTKRAVNVSFAGNM